MKKFFAIFAAAACAAAMSPFAATDAAAEDFATPALATAGQHMTAMNVDLMMDKVRDRTQALLLVKFERNNAAMLAKIENTLARPKTETIIVAGL